jgi:hypothetical protein
MRLSQPAIHSAALGFDGVWFIGTNNPAYGDGARDINKASRYRRASRRLQRANVPVLLA